MATYLVTGASRGIGLELVRQLLELPVSQVSKVFAVARSSNSAALQDLLKSHSGRVISITASVDDTESVEKSVEAVERELNGQGLDVLVNNAGVSAYSPGGMKTVQPETLTQLLDVNVVGPQRMITAYLPLLEQGKQKKVINVSSTLASIAWAEKFKPAPTHAYKVSKTALNMLNKQYALDHAGAGFTFLCVSPGWLKTDLGGRDAADLPVEVGVSELKRIILEASPAQNGKFVNIHVPGQEDAWGHYDGGEVPW